MHVNTDLVSKVCNKARLKDMKRNKNDVFGCCPVSCRAIKALFWNSKTNDRLECIFIDLNGKMICFWYSIRDSDWGNERIFVIYNLYIMLRLVDSFLLAETWVSGGSTKRGNPECVRIDSNDKSFCSLLKVMEKWLITIWSPSYKNVTLIVSNFQQIVWSHFLHVSRVCFQRVIRFFQFSTAQ